MVKCLENERVEYIFGVPREENIDVMAEPGVIGGVPQSGADFGAAVNADAIIDRNQQRSARLRGKSVAWRQISRH